jgi:hypothetical protein
MLLKGPLKRKLVAFGNLSEITAFNKNKKIRK